MGAGGCATGGCWASTVSKSTSECAAPDQEKWEPVSARIRRQQGITMFTGIITDIGTIAAVEHRGALRVTVATGYDTSPINLGESIACSGVCLTVVALGPGRFTVDVSGESVARAAQEQRSAG